MWAGQDDTQRFKTRVLKPPGGGSSDIFGSVPEETNPRRIKNHNQSQLGSALFGDGPIERTSSAGSGVSSADCVDTPRAYNKPGNDSHNRLFGPPDAPPATPNAKNHMRSNISLSGESTNSNVSTTSSVVNGYNAAAAAAAAAVVVTAAAAAAASAGKTGKPVGNDNTGGSCMPRNPVTGEGVVVTPSRRMTRRSRDGNPVTGMGYETESVQPIQNGRTMSSSSSSIGDKSSDSTPAAKVQQRGRVPPGGYSSGLW